jgi:hypothetical protein
MEVRYTLTVDDYVAFYIYMCRKSISAWVHYAVGCVAIHIICVLFGVGLVGDGVALGAVIATVLSVPVGVHFHRSYSQKVAQDMRDYVVRQGLYGPVGPITLILSEAAILEITETARTEVKWTDVERVEEVGDATYILISAESFAIWPRIGFARDEEYHAARDFALRAVPS